MDIIPRRLKKDAPTPIPPTVPDNDPGDGVKAEPLKSKRRRPRWQKALAAVLILVALVGGYFGVRLFLATKEVITENLSGGAAILFGGDLKGEGEGRINILLLGVGGPGHDGPNLADTILIASIEPKLHAVSLLSIPRDFYVKIPGDGSTKINAVNHYGEERRFPGGGPALMKKTLSELLDISIHYYVKVDFTGFQKIIDAIGGVDLTVERAIYDPYFPSDAGRGYKPFRIAAGKQHLDGYTALRYSRSRETTSDFDRAKRQQQVLVALREKSLSLGTLSNPAKVSSIISAVKDHFRTDLQLWEIRKLTKIMKELNSSATQTKVLDPTTGVVVSSSIGGAYVLIPSAGIGSYSKIQDWVHSYFSDAYLRSEAAKLAVYNGSGSVGVAAETTEFLRGYGYNVVLTANAPAAQAKTTLTDYTGGKKPYTAKYLESRFRVTAERRPLSEAGDGSELKLVLGADFKRSYLGR